VLWDQRGIPRPQGAACDIGACELVQGTTSIALTLPADGAWFAAPATFNLEAVASASSGTITNVSFYDDDRLLGHDRTSPYALNLLNLGRRSYRFTAVASDSLGLRSTSAVVAVTVVGPVQAQINQASSGDMILIPAGVHEDGLVLCQDLTLKGAGPGASVIDAAGTGVVLCVCSNATVRLEGVTLQNGFATFGEFAPVCNFGQLTLCNVVVQSNRAETTAAGIGNYGSLWATNLTVEGNQGVGSVVDGALLNAGSAFLSAATARNNESWLLTLEGEAAVLQPCSSTLIVGDD
jgi:hypothetical protein